MARVIDNEPDEAMVQVLKDAERGAVSGRPSLVQDLQSKIDQLEREGNAAKLVRQLQKRVDQLEERQRHDNSTAAAEAVLSAMPPAVEPAVEPAAEPAGLPAGPPAAAATSAPSTSGAETRAKHERNAAKLHKQFGVCGFHCLHQHVRTGPNRPVCRNAVPCPNGSHDVPDGLLRWAFANLEQY